MYANAANTFGSVLSRRTEFADFLALASFGFPRRFFFLFHYFRDNLGGLPHIEVVQKSKPVKHYEICLQAKSDMYSWNWLPRYVVDMETVHELLQETTG